MKMQAIQANYCPTFGSAAKRIITKTFKKNGRIYISSLPANPAEPSLISWVKWGLGQLSKHKNNGQIIVEENVIKKMGNAKGYLEELTKKSVNDCKKTFGMA